MAASVRPSPGRKSDKLMRDAISVALHRTKEVDGETRKNIYLVAAKLVDKAIEGDIAAIKEINDRMDGKSPVAIVGDDDKPLILQIIERRIVKA